MTGELAMPVTRLSEKTPEERQLSDSERRKAAKRLADEAFRECVNAFIKSGGYGE